ncbi:MAG: glycosyltransferase family 4 protein [Rubritepida sp.]|nr:glycosyltransferase family 4 protein [Rubritepida sp.]
MPPQVRCLLVAQTFPPVLGGSAEVYAALARHAGGAIAVLTARRDHMTGGEHPGWAALDAALPHPVERIPLIRPLTGAAAGGSRLRRRIAWAAGAARLALAVTAAARRHRAAAICLGDDDAAGWLAPFARRVLRRRVLIYCHGDDLVEEDPRAIAWRRRWFAEADMVVAAGDFAAARLAEGYGVPAAHIARLPNGVDLARFGPRPEPEGLRGQLGLDGRRVILAAARLVPRKGVDRLIEALPAVLAQEPRAALLVVGDGPQRPALEAAAAGLPVHFAGAVPAAEMPALYALAEVFALPNRAEPGESDGLPLVFLEAQASGLPVLGGRAGGTAEAVRDGETGLLVAGEDAAEVARGVLRLLQDGALAQRLAAAGRAAAQQRGWAARASAFLELCGPAPR